MLGRVRVHEGVGGSFSFGILNRRGLTTTAPKFLLSIYADIAHKLGDVDQAL